MANRSATRGQAAESGSVEPDCARYMASFWPDDPELWFAQLESQTGGLTDSQRYNLVLAKLDSRTIREVADVIANPPEKDRYAAVKGELIGRLSSTRQEKIRQLLEKEEIGDRSPSKFLRHLKALAGSSTTDEFLETIWMRRLPPSLRPILTVLSPDLPLDKVAAVADRVYKELPQAPSAPAIEEASSSSNSELAEVRRELKELRSLRDEMIEIAREMRQLSRSASRSRSRSPSTGRQQRRRSRSPAARDHCWYHREFGNRSTKCRAPCSFQQSGNEGNRH